MSAALQIAAVSVAAFASTNLDALFLLVALYGADERGAPRVAAGYVAATVLVAALAWAGASALEQLPVRWLDSLGVIPIALGAARARELFAGRPGAAAERGDTSFRIAVIATLAQSADNLAVFAPLFADARGSLEPVILASVTACALAWIGAAYWLARNSPFARAIQRFGRIALPLLLIGIGVHMLLDAETDEPEEAGARYEAPVNSSPGAPPGGVRWAGLTHVG